MDYSTPGFPILHHLLEVVQTHVHWVCDAIQPSHPLSPLLLLTSIFPEVVPPPETTYSYSFASWQPNLDGRLHGKRKTAESPKVERHQWGSLRGRVFPAEGESGPRHIHGRVYHPGVAKGTRHWAAARKQLSYGPCVHVSSVSSVLSDSLRPYEL